jgi:hypothetical protein
VTLEVPGRRTGRVISFPLVMVDHEDDRYLVAVLGQDANWVRNVRAAGGRGVLRHGRRETVRLAQVAPAARGMQMRRQWKDGDDVCSLYTFDVEAPAGAVSVLVSEWNTVRDGEVASSLAVFDTCPFQCIWSRRLTSRRSHLRHDRRPSHRTRPSQPQRPRLLLLQPELRAALR